MTVLLVVAVVLVILAMVSAMGRRTQSRRPHWHWWVWRLRPRTPDDCPRCRRAADLLERRDPSLAVPPWRQGRSRRGVPRRISTEGYADRVHHCLLRGLRLPHLQLDEIRVRLRLRHRATWLWLALDLATKLIPALALGPRTQHTAHALVHGLRAALAPDCVPVVTTDGLRHYFYALTAHFGRWVTARGRRRWEVHPALLYGQVHKQYRHRRLARVRRRAVCGQGGRLRAALRSLGWTGLVQTAFVERLNLTARQSVAAPHRRTWATAHGVAGVLRQVAWWRAYYHFSRPHRSLRCRGRPCTPAMAAGLTTHRWTTLEALSYPCARAA